MRPSQILVADNAIITLYKIATPHNRNTGYKTSAAAPEIAKKLLEKIPMGRRGTVEELAATVSAIDEQVAESNRSGALAVEEADEVAGTARNLASASQEIGDKSFYYGSGCDLCNNTGYKGRVGLYEVMEVTEELRELILVGASSLELRRKAIEQGMITLRQSGLQKVKNGVTTVEEVVRETVK